MEIKSDRQSGIIKVDYKQWTFVFPLSICLEFSRYLQGAFTQQFVQADLDTQKGKVLLYGYIDELLPFKIVDIKTTSKYQSFKYRNNWQHIVYPYCLIESGNLVSEFEYAVTDFKDTYSEVYIFDIDNDTRRLINHCEHFIEFLEANKERITDKKIFAQDEIQLSR